MLLGLFLKVGEKVLRVISTLRDYNGVFAFWYLGHPARIVIFLFQSLC